MLTNSCIALYSVPNATYSPACPLKDLSNTWKYYVYSSCASLLRSLLCQCDNVPGFDENVTASTYTRAVPCTASPTCVYVVASFPVFYVAHVTSTPLY